MRFRWRRAISWARRSLSTWVEYSAGLGALPSPPRGGGSSTSARCAPSLTVLATAATALPRWPDEPVLEIVMAVLLASAYRSSNRKERPQPATPDHLGVTRMRVSAKPNKQCVLIGFTAAPR
jgi:hypothetical protein